MYIVVNLRLQPWYILVQTVEKKLFMPATYTVKQVAQILGYSTNSIYTFLKEKRIKGVRVGRGRFRIPQFELDRLLMTAKGGTVLPQLPVAYSQLTAPVGPPVAATGVVEPVHANVMSQAFPVSFPVPKVDVPSLFDWFIGIGSIVLGLAMFLFSKTNEEYAVERFIAWMPAIRMTLIAGGFGLLLTDVVGKKFSAWHRLFHGALIISFIGYAFILGQIGNLEGVIIYGSVAAMLLVTFFVGFGGIAGFSSYIVLLLILIPGAAILSPTNSSIINILSIIPVPSAFLVGIWFTVIACIAVLLWIGYQRSRSMFWTGMVSASALLIMLAMHYANNLWWGRTLFILIAAVISLFVPVWQSLTFSHKRDRAFIFTSFGSLLVLYIIVVGALRVMQTNIIDYASRELQNKVTYGKQLVESTISSAHTALSSGATNQFLVTALEKTDEKTLTDIAKSLFESNTILRRVVMASARGDVLSSYPYSTTASAETYGERDYFLQALAGKKAVTSDQYESPADKVRRKSIIVSVPVLGKKADVVGVIIGSVDLETLGNKLQQIASGKTKEYFVVVDRSGKRVIHPDYGLLGTQVDENDIVRRALDGAAGIGEGYSNDGIRTLVAFDQINDTTHWGIAVKAPIAEILNSTNAAGITIATVVVISIALVCVFLASHQVRSIIPDSGFVSDLIARESRVVAALEKKALGKRKKREDTS